MSGEHTKKVISILIFVSLIVLSFFLLKPLIMPIIIGVILAFIFAPIYRFVLRFLKKKTLSAIVVCIILIALFIIPLWYAVPLAIDESIKFYVESQKWDFTTPLKNIFPSIFKSDEFAAEIGRAIHTFVSNTANSLMNYLSQVLLKFPSIVLKLLVTLFAFFFFLRDRDNISEYIRSLLPFSKDVKNKLFKSSNDLTFSILYGQVGIGILEGIVTGTGLFIFNVPGALLLTVISTIAGILPIIGTAVVWVPVVVYLFIQNSPVAALGVMLFGLVSSFMESFLKPLFISKRAKMNTAIVLFGMVGGLMLLGLIGVVIGPLILAYLFIILEIYRDKRIQEGVIIPPEKE